MRKGTVYLIGAGPGDPGLITAKGLALVKNADVIVYDYLVSEGILAHARADAEKIYVGKKGSQHTLEQEGINQLLVDKAREDKSIARLKGGDPFVFGRGGEEALFLKENGVPFEIIPGITAAIAAPAYAGIPVTNRGYTSTFALVTGHEDPTKESSDINWSKLATAAGTITFYMGVKNLPNIVEQLVKHGRDKNTPCAVIRWGTTTKQETVTSTLENIVEAAKDIKPPAITLVGEVAALRDQLQWFESKPLFGRRIVVTRSRAQASEMVIQLEEEGAAVIEFPTIKVNPPDNWNDMDNAITNLSETDWIIFTSVHGVQFFVNRLFEKELDVRALAGLRICAIGPATAKEVEKHSLRVDCIPPKYIAESVVEHLTGMENLAGQKVLLPRSDIARSMLPEELSKLGAKVTDIVAYRTVTDDVEAEAMRQKIADGEVDVVTFTSSSTVRNFVELVGKDTLRKVGDAITYASIGPITTETAQELGLTITIEAAEYTIPGLVDAVVQHFAQE